MQLSFCLLLYSQVQHCIPCIDAVVHWAVHQRLLFVGYKQNIRPVFSISQTCSAIQMYEIVCRMQLSFCMDQPAFRQHALSHSAAPRWRRWASLRTMSQSCGARVRKDDVIPLLVTALTSYSSVCERCPIDRKSVAPSSCRRR